MPINTSLLAVGLSVAFALQVGVTVIAVWGGIYSLYTPLEEPVRWFGLMLGMLTLSLGASSATNAPVRLNGATLGLMVPAGLCFLNAHVTALAGAGMVFLCIAAFSITLTALRHIKSRHNAAKPL